ncbi:NUDIX domain-containing protein [Candidatus Woesebacteria bacterium]|nr:NUDIX domain-containing protein [Candidatus Woesebacteria bacterium]
MNLHTIYETSAGGMVYCDKSTGRQWLVIQHSKARHWGFPKGHVGDKIPNEKLEEAAIREVVEEGGVQAQIISDKPFTTTYFFRYGNTLHKKTVYYYLMMYISGDPSDHDAEVKEAKFAPEKDIPAILTYDSDKEAFRKALHHLESLA